MTTMKKISALVTAALIATAPAVALAPLSTAQVQDNNPALQQVVEADEAIAPLGERTVISAGHADLGPMFVDGQLQFLVRDDTHTPAVWRHLEDVVFEVSDAAKQTLPETNDFDFTGAKPGSDVWVVPQTEVAGVPWLGWNSQAPSLLERSTSGMSLEYGGHSGPGSFSLFVQPGGFHEPQQLWNSSTSGTQSMWVEPNTHTHANWVFTEAGVQLVNVRVNVEDTEGTVHTDEQMLRFAVSTDASQAFDAEFDTVFKDAAGGDRAQTSTSTGLIAGVGIGVLVLAAIAFVLVRGRKK